MVKVVLMRTTIRRAWDHDAVSVRTVPNGSRIIYCRVWTALTRLKVELPDTLYSANERVQTSFLQVGVG